MSNPAYARAHRLLAWLWLLALLLAASFLLFTRTTWQGRVDTDLLTLLPTDERRPALETARKALSTQGERQLVLLVSAHEEKDGGSADTRKAAALLRETLRELVPDLKTQNDFAAFPGDFYAGYSAGMMTDADLDWQKTATPEAAHARAMNLLYAPFPTSGVPWTSDPFGFFGNWLQSLGEASPLRPSGGEWMVEHDGAQYAALMYVLPESAFASGFQQKLMAALDAAENKLHVAFPASQLLRAGVVLHAAAATQQAESEMHLIGFGSLLGTFILIGLVFQSARALRLIVVSLLSGAIVALMATLMIFERVHLITLVFGASLIGVTVDYAILVFAQHLGNAEPVWERHRRLLPTLCLLLLAPVLAHVGLLMTPFPGLIQMGTFAIFGIFGAWTSVVLFYPCLLPKTLPLPKRAEVVASLLRHWPRWQGGRKQWGIALVALLMLGGGLVQLQTNDDIRSLFSGNPKLIAEQLAVSRIMQLPSPAQIFLVSASDEETLLQREEALITRLRPLMASGKISGFEAVSRWLPSEAQQRDARGAKEALQSTLAQLQKELELPAGWAHEQSASNPRPIFLTPENWRVSPISQPFRALWLGETASGDGAKTYSSMVLLKGLADSETAATLAQLPAAEPAIAEVEWVDQTKEISRLMQRYRLLLTQTLLAACLIAPLLLYAFFRRAVWRVITPVVMAGLATLSIMGYLGIPVQLLSILALLLTLGMGIDYAIFLQARQTHAHTLLATTLAASLTLLSFGLLALSSTPALHALGLTATLGVTLSWLLTPVFCQRK
ncbi:membrane protein [Betaproteobacteria bacterium]|nr:membrane protein [Betaproteobacteria bacterium]GHU43928.1 membrane protein [Betaproteobacteria bacterium]